MTDLAKATTETNEEQVYYGRPLTITDLYKWAVKHGYEHLPVYKWHDGPTDDKGFHEMTMEPVVLMDIEDAHGKHGEDVLAVYCEPEA